MFYHLRLRCFVVINLKIEEFKPEFAGKMNFYLSAVDDQIRYGDDAPSIGIILCKGKNEVVVDYALRDSVKPMGVAEYRLSSAPPAQLANALPTVEELAREFPLMLLVQLRIEIERELRSIAEARGAIPEKQTGVVQMLRDLERDGALPALGPDLRSALDGMNSAAHGLDVEPGQIEHAMAAGARLLEMLRNLKAG